MAVLQMDRPRGNRLCVEGGIFHLTHRCHHHAFHVRLARDRNSYREKRREALQIYDVALLDYCPTCNHVHLLVDAEQKSPGSGSLQEVQKNLEAEIQSLFW